VVAFLFVGAPAAQPYVRVALLSLLAMIGVFSCSQGPPASSDSPGAGARTFLGALANGATDGVVVPTRPGRVVSPMRC
jgi:hypothetical protein